MGRAPEGDAAALRGSNGRAVVGQIMLRQLDMHKSGGVTFYGLHFALGQDSWSVERRYTDFLRCHVQLLERFGRDELPPFPPKEPVLQKIFGRGGARSEWAEERRSLLRQYLAGLLAHAGAARSEALLRFVQAPDGQGPPGEPAPGAVLISGVRVRLTGEPGGIEVVVRAEAVGACSVRLALRRLTSERDGELPVMPDLTDLTLGDMEVWDRWLELELSESEAGGNSEAAHRFLLEPGSLWQVGAVGVSQEGLTGNAVCIQLRAPTEVEMAQLPQLPSPAPASAPAPRSAAAGGPEGGEEEAEESEVWAEAGAALPTDAAHSEEDTAPNGVQVWPVTHTRRTSDAAAAAQASAHAAAAAAEEAEAEEDEEAEELGEAHNDAITLSEAESGSVDVSSEAKPMPAARATVKAKAKCIAESSVAEARAALLKDSARRLRRGPEVHKVISYQGQAAAEYARKIEEKQRVWMERVPHRFETTRDGGPRSVQARLTVVKKEEEGAPVERQRQPAELLDRGRQAQQLMRLKEDERLVAGWIHAVTGDAQAQAAAQGECSLHVALETGEALCDLVNAVWPGRIIGILRGDVKPHKRISNVTRFLRACSDLGIGDQNIFTPSDLAEGKNLRNVVRCLLTLGASVPEPPDYAGPRLEDGLEPTMEKAGTSSGESPDQSASTPGPRRATM